jgi:hypothetical protein
MKICRQLLSLILLFSCACATLGVDGVVRLQERGGHAISGKTLAILGAASAATLAAILIFDKDEKKCVSPSGGQKMQRVPTVLYFCFAITRECVRA